MVAKQVDLGISWSWWNSVSLQPSSQPHRGCGRNGGRPGGVQKMARVLGMVGDDINLKHETVCPLLVAHVICACVVALIAFNPFLLLKQSHTLAYTYTSCMQ